ncbi:MAG: methyltransferase domain-containing protein [Candidatus Nanohaloarchaea archaeon]|nr:methyltransferase domain-containing protein [Candidatus Nanohaloarchaea archaeon]
MKLITSFRDVDETFSITSSRYRNSIDLHRMEDNLVNEIQDRTGWRYTEDSHSNFDIRVHVEFKNVLVSVRLTEKPLYYRSYWTCGRKGSLKTSVAAAMCKLADPEPGSKMVDNFCGAGTILCEGERQGMKPFGGDIDSEAVECSRTNLRENAPETANQVKTLDAKATGWPDSYFDLAASNLPWGKQVELNAVELYSQSISEYARILKDQGKVVLLCKMPDLAEKHLRKNFPDHNIDRFRLGFLGQKPWIVYAHPPDRPMNLVEQD